MLPCMPPRPRRALLLLLLAGAGALLRASHMSMKGGAGAEPVARKWAAMGLLLLLLACLPCLPPLWFCAA